MGTGMNTEGFSEEVSLQRALKDDGRGPTATWRSSLSRGLGLEGTWGSRTRADPEAGDTAEEPVQGSRLKTVREKPCRKAQCRPHGSERGIYYRPSPNNAAAAVEVEDAISRSFPFGKHLLVFSVEQGSAQNSTSQTALPALAPALQQLPRLAGGGGSVPPACRLRPRDLL